jgi:GGDEF domain-containing protein
LRVRNALSRAARLSTTNPVSDLPENELVDEKLNGLILTDKEWALVLMAIGGLNEFREQYGFVAADDVLRAVTLMIRNAVREHGNEEDFIGHLGPEDFIVITTPEKVGEIRLRIENRVRQSREYFYPLKDRERAKEAAEAKQLRLRSGLLEKSGGLFENVEAIKTALYAGSVVD